MSTLLAPEPTHDDLVLDTTLRPSSIEEYIGQEQVKKTLRIAIDAARVRTEALEHVLLYGGPGLGKTTLAMIVAKELRGNIRMTSGPAVERPGDLAAVLTNLQSGDILFIDECHRLPKTVEELLYPAMEDRALDIMIGKGPAARTLRIDLPPFTLVAATTRLSLLSAPLRDRFGFHFHIDFYTPEELLKIINRSATIFGMQMEPSAAEAVAQRSRRTPRLANRLLKRVRDVAQVRNQTLITASVVEEAFTLLGVDALGLDGVDRKILETLIGKFRGGPVGVQALAAATNEEVETILEVYEPFLLQCGFLDRTPRGRIATSSAYQHLGIAIPVEQSSLI